jgi:hypothetical protein
LSRGTLLASAEPVVHYTAAGKTTNGVCSVFPGAQTVFASAPA